MKVADARATPSSSRGRQLQSLRHTGLPRRRPAKLRQGERSRVPQARRIPLPVRDERRDPHSRRRRASAAPCVKRCRPSSTAREYAWSSSCPTCDAAGGADDARASAGAGAPRCPRVIVAGSVRIVDSCLRQLNKKGTRSPTRRGQAGVKPDDRSRWGDQAAARAVALNTRRTPEDQERPPLERYVTSRSSARCKQDSARRLLAASSAHRRRQGVLLSPRQLPRLVQLAHLLRDPRSLSHPRQKRAVHRRRVPPHRRLAAKYSPSPAGSWPRRNPRRWRLR